MSQLSYVFVTDASSTSHSVPNHHLHSIKTHSTAAYSNYSSPLPCRPRPISCSVNLSFQLYLHERHSKPICVSQVQHCRKLYRRITRTYKRLDFALTQSDFIMALHLWWLKNFMFITINRRNPSSNHHHSSHSVASCLSESFPFVFIRRHFAFHSTSISCSTVYSNTPLH